MEKVLSKMAKKMVKFEGKTKEMESKKREVVQRSCKKY